LRVAHLTALCSSRPQAAAADRPAGCAWRCLKVYFSLHWPTDRDERRRPQVAVRPRNYASFDSGVFQHLSIDPDTAYVVLLVPVVRTIPALKLARRQQLLQLLLLPTKFCLLQPCIKSSIQSAFSLELAGMWNDATRKQELTDASSNLLSQPPY
jgi:hypothetical protein